MLRNGWRALTSMRIALVLLFLLALGALPGALLPQRSLNQRLVDQYFADHPTLAPLLDRLGFFDVFAAPWFAAVYLLLMISLVGCVLPRALEHARALRAAPVAVPRNLARLPHHAVATLDVPAEEATAAVRARLKGWRVAESPDGISAEKGYLREAGNLVFHLALIGLLVGFAGGKLFGYEGQVIVQADGGQFCNTGILGYDSFRAGLRVDGTGLDPFCVKVDDFTATYLPNGQAAAFAATVGYQSADDLAAGVQTWRPFPLAVNHPLRLDGERVYLQGHGYTPRFTVTFPDGQQRTGADPVEPGRPHHDAVGGRHEVPAPGRLRRGRCPAWRSPGCSPRPRPAATSSPRCSRRRTTRRWPSTCCAATSASTTGAASRSSASTRPRSTPGRW